jgi:hypothetical protein
MNLRTICPLILTYDSDLKAFELCRVRGWDLSYESLTSYEMREKLRSLKTTDPTFWAELCNDVASNVPKEGETVVEDEEVVEDDDSVGDDSAVGIAEVVAEVLKLKEGSRTDGKTDGLTLSNFAEDDGLGEAPTNNPAMNILTSNSDPATSSKIVTTVDSERGKRKRVANKWYPMKNFIRHDDNDSDADSLADMYM